MFSRYPAGSSASAPSASASTSASISGPRSSFRGLTLLAHSACLLPLHPHPPPLTLSVPSFATGSTLGVTGAAPSSPPWSPWGCSRPSPSKWVPPRAPLRAMTRLLKFSTLSLARAALPLASASRISLRLVLSTRLHSPWNSSASRVPVKTMRTSILGATTAYGPDRSPASISSSLPRLSDLSQSSPKSMRRSFSLSQMYVRCRTGSPLPAPLMRVHLHLLGPHPGPLGSFPWQNGWPSCPRVWVASTWP